MTEKGQEEKKGSHFREPFFVMGNELGVMNCERWHPSSERMKNKFSTFHFPF